MILSPRRHSFQPVSSYQHSLQQHRSQVPTMPMDTSQDVPSNFSSTANNTYDTSPSPTNNKRKREDPQDDPEITTPFQQETAAMEALRRSLNADLHQPSINWSTDRPMNSANQVETVHRTTPEDDVISDVPAQKCPRRESSPPKDPHSSHSPQNGSSEPIVDEFTYQLGVGWSSINSDPDTQKAKCGWEKYIENHYQLSDVDIILIGKALEGSLLVCARNGAGKGYYLFSEDLSEARFVACSWELCKAQLMCKDYSLGNRDVLKAAKTPTLGAKTMEGVSETSPQLPLEPQGEPGDEMMLLD